VICKSNYNDFTYSLFVGNDVVIVKNGKRICGTGAALSNAPIAQDKAYFEVKLQSTGKKNCHKLHYTLNILKFNFICDHCDKIFIN